MKKYYLLLAGLIFCLSVRSQQTQFRIIGYVRLQNIIDGQANKIDYSKITHLNIAFVNPDAAGNFAPIFGLKTFVNKIHQSHVKVFASIGGGLAPGYYSNLLTSANRQAFTTKLAQLTDLYGLDGIDVDLEGERIDGNYEGFITGLASALKTKGKLLTAAVATIYQTRYTDKALAQFDFINIMSYDKTGPWRPEIAGPHAPYQMAVEDMNYWTGEKHIAKERLNLGLPFYGYGFGRDIPTELSFKEVAIKYSWALNTDSVNFKGGGAFYYNGIPTIKNKTTLALQKAGGVMIWQLLQDAPAPNSLLGTINAVIKVQGN